VFVARWLFFSRAPRLRNLSPCFMFPLFSRVTIFFPFFPSPKSGSHSPRNRDVPTDSASLAFLPPLSFSWRTIQHRFSRPSLIAGPLVHFFFDSRFSPSIYGDFLRSQPFRLIHLPAPVKSGRAGRNEGCGGPLFSALQSPNFKRPAERPDTSKLLYGVKLFPLMEAAAASTF